MPLTYLPDRMPKAELERRHRDVAESLRRRWPVMMDNSQQSVAWVGIARADPENAVVFLPHGAPETEAFCKQLMQAIVRFARESGREGEAQDIEAASQAALFADLASDYRDFGLFSTREKFRSLQEGKPDWARTIKIESAFPTPTGAPVYFDIHSARYSSKSSNIVARIQAHVICELEANHLWWLKPFFGDRALPEAVGPLPWPREVWSHLLKSARRDLFEDRAIRLVGMLLDYLAATSKTGAGHVICGLSDFSTLWETMLRETLSGVERHWNSMLPGPVYSRTSGPADTVGRMETDVVVRRSGRLIILDAKYYRATARAWVPGLSDISKQVLYRMAVESTGLVGEDTIDNAFVFPAGETCREPYKDIEFILPGGAPAGAFGKVKCQYLSISDVVEAYAQKRTLRDQSWLSDLGKVA